MARTVLNSLLSEMRITFKRSKPQFLYDSEYKASESNTLKQQYNFARAQCLLTTFAVQESLANANVSARQQCMYKGRYRRNLQGGPKKVSLHSLHITSQNTGRFSKFFHCHILQEICNKTIIKYPTSPQTCRYTTL